MPEIEPEAPAKVTPDTDEIHDDLTLAQRPRVQDEPTTVAPKEAA